MPVCSGIWPQIHRDAPSARPALCGAGAGGVTSGLDKGESVHRGERGSPLGILRGASVAGCTVTFTRQPTQAVQCPPKTSCSYRIENVPLRGFLKNHKRGMGTDLGIHRYPVCCFGLEIRSHVAHAGLEVTV